MTRPSPQRRVPPPESSPEWLTDDIERSRRPRFSIWRALSVLAAMIGASMILSVIFGPGPLTCLLAIPAGLVLYELWYLLFESSL